MRLTRAGEYGVRCVAFLAIQAARGVSTPSVRSKIARQMEIPEAFLAKIIPQLHKAGIVTITRGSRGGLQLACPADQVTLLDVVEAVSGRIALNDCVLRPGSCHKTPTCPVHCVWVTASNQLRDTLSQANFASIAGCMPPQSPTDDAQHKEQS